MVCFVFKTSLNKNYIKLKEIDNKFKNLFKNVIQSKTIKESMLKDYEAKQLDYPFDDDEILDECEESIFYVPFPVPGFYG